MSEYFAAAIGAMVASFLLFGCAGGEPGKTITSSDGKFYIEADDENFYSEGETAAVLSVRKGTPVSITFRVREENVYFAGLAFKGCGQTTPDAGKGESVTMEFTADSDCEIISYWPANGAPKKTIVVDVK
jgi:hypothetical protein